jgi:hypothetical protein
LVVLATDSDRLLEIEYGNIEYHSGFTYNMYIPTYYLETLSKDDSSIKEIEPDINVNNFYPTRFHFFNIAVIFSPPARIAPYETEVFYITSMKKYNNYYKIITTSYVPADTEYSKLKEFVTGEEYIFYIHHNNNRVRIYIEGEEQPKWELMKAGDEFLELFEQFPSKGWTGKQDYKSYLASYIFEPWEILTLTEIKQQIAEVEQLEIKRPESPTRQIAENLRLRSEPNTNGEIVATLQAGDLVYLLKTGETQTIDGISAPWVKVQLQNGQEGWVFAGYLKTLPE